MLPLIFARGAGAEQCSNLGIVVCCGLLFATLLTVYVVPALYALGLARRSEGSPGRTAWQLQAQISVTTRSEPRYH